uniref:Cytochrome c oxidase subunit 3 n=1 Tax=Ostrea lurida TaxID=627230 RepID=U3LWC7_9BIVA|nr:cytochrome c oxidase subunit III [Ostrea lurida]AGM48338.1 cytochrome c oxidase subunit 3 [Ostrea lurida]
MMKLYSLTSKKLFSGFKNQSSNFTHSSLRHSSHMLPRSPYHILDPSPWPVLMAIGLWGLAMTFICWANGVPCNSLLLGAVIAAMVVYGWTRDLVNEGTFQGFHTKKVQSGLTMGFILFLVSELMLFFSFFWGFFHSALSPSLEIGCCWPPAGIDCLDWSKAPLHNTALLVASSCTVTSSHKYLKTGNFSSAVGMLLLTVLLSALFVKNQYGEYAWSSFTIADGVYGSCFFMLTGLHGMHVMGGTSGLLYCLVRMLARQFSTTHHLAYTFAIWYWHFVDVVWLALFFIIYIWGS